MSDDVKIAILCSGIVWKTKVPRSSKISKLMVMAVSHFHGSLQKPEKCRIVLVRSRTILSSNKTVGEEELKDSDELMLVEFPTSSMQAADNLRGPTESEIFEATKHLECRNTEKSSYQTGGAEDDLDYSERFSKDCLRIFVTLVESAAHLLTYAPNGMEIYEVVKKELTRKLDPSSHSPYVKQLTDMGFPEGMVIKALKATKMNFSDAMEWLLEQDPNSRAVEVEPTTSKSQPATVFDAFHELVQSTLRKRHDNFKIHLKHVQHLEELGYETKDIENALRETDNNLQTAILYLNQDSSKKMSQKQPLHLDPHGSMCKALMASEVIQLNVKNPKFLLALLSILEEPQKLIVWLKDREIGCILNHIILLHNTEISGGRYIS